MAQKKIKSTESLKGLGEKVIKDIEKNKNPGIEVPIRALSNVIFNEKTKTLELGNKTSNRFFFNVAHAKKFLQTIEIASISKDLINENKHASLRDVFYMAKRTIPGTNVNLVDEQSESDDIIEDLELVTGNSKVLVFSLKITLLKALIGTIMLGFLLLSTSLITLVPSSFNASA